MRRLDIKLETTKYSKFSKFSIDKIGIYVFLVLNNKSIFYWAHKELQ